MSGFWPTVALVASLAFTSPLVAQAGSRPEAFFWAGLLTALVPMLVLGALGGVTVYLYLRERRSGEADPRDGETREGGSA